MPLPQFVKFNNLLQIVESFCGSHKAIRFRPLDRDSEGFSGAVVIQVAVQSDGLSTEAEYCLRGWPPNSFPRERLLGLHRLLEHVHRAGVTQVAVPLRNQFGSTISTEASQFWQLEPWMPGVADFSSHPTDTRLRNAMIVLAKWHNGAAQFVAKSSEAEWFHQQASDNSATVDDRLLRIGRFNVQGLAKLRHLIDLTKELEFWDTQFAELRELAKQTLNLFQLCAAQVGDTLMLFREMQFRLLPCLRDVWHDHVLFTDDEVTGLIDCNAARTETPATDIARLLGSFLGDDDDRWEMAISAYREARPLSGREAQLARVLDQSTVLLSGLTWIERLFVQRLSYSNPDRVLSRLRQIVGRLQHLAARKSLIIQSSKGASCDER